jgi:hypothetical protein
MQLSQLCAHIENQIRLEAGGDLASDIAAMRAALEQALKAIGRELGEAT